jgi:hypothetical protein
MLLLVGLLGGLPATAGAVAPNDLTFQGRLLEADGRPFEGQVQLEIGIWTALQGGDLVYGEVHPAVPVLEGVFGVLLGTGTVPSGGTPLDPDVFADPERYLELRVDGELLEPRLPVSSVPYALQSARSTVATFAATAASAASADSVGALGAGDVASTTALSDVEARVTQLETTSPPDAPVATDVAGALCGLYWLSGEVAPAEVCEVVTGQDQCIAGQTLFSCECLPTESFGITLCQRDDALGVCTMEARRNGIGDETPQVSAVCKEFLVFECPEGQVAESCDCDPGPGYVLESCTRRETSCQMTTAPEPGAGSPMGSVTGICGDPVCPCFDLATLQASTETSCQGGSGVIRSGPDATFELFFSSFPGIRSCRAFGEGQGTSPLEFAVCSQHMRDAFGCP